MGDERSASAIDRKLGQRVRAYRLEIGMSQEELADRLGITFQQVQKYEKGFNRMAASRLFDIAATLGLPISELFEGLSSPLSGKAPENEARSAIDAMRETKEGREMMALFASVKSVRVRKRLLELARALIEDDHESGEKPNLKRVK
jgi:transcriptional regulator with XRE-family HTH domain